eukprot:TRINITY_DN579_c0_g1_i2.p1 TRINITY_DN579_c0_g1~~TRINITY_DN579_c0_g1_i2.p1  ORF type:complete len:107 (+),score=4.97 TRINITY_DN579_c0_g1_i2:281-601(+)
MFPMAAIATPVPDFPSLKPTIYRHLPKISTFSASLSNQKQGLIFPYSHSISFSRMEVAVQPSPPPKQKHVDNNDNDYYVNLGTAIRTLREELPVLFSKDLTYDIYR